MNERILRLRAAVPSIDETTNLLSVRWNTSAEVKQADVGLAHPDRNLLQPNVIAAIDARRIIWVKYSGAR